MYMTVYDMEKLTENLKMEIKKKKLKQQKP